MSHGGTVREMYGSSLGRVMSTGPADVTAVYFYGTININISGGVINDNVYGAGAGGATGYHLNSTDQYRAIGISYATSTNITMTGGTVNGNIYGGGYGYTELLTLTYTITDAGALYGNSNISILGGTVTGNIYGAGRGTNIYGTTRAALAQMIRKY